MQGKRRHVFGNIFDLRVQAESVLLEPAQAWIGRSPTIFIFGEAGDCAIVDDFAFGVAPAAVDDLVDGHFVDVAGDDAIDQFRGVAAGYAVLK